MLYIVATPIGNLQDITLRALDTLKKVDLIVCEDTRVTAKLLNKYEIKKSLLSYHQHSKNSKVDKIINKLKEGKNIALVTDAGTPGISDPGNVLVAEAIKNNIKIEAIPGVSAVTMLLSVAGIDTQKFIFLGFPPHKKGRQTFFIKAKEYDIPVVFYESRYRILKTLKSLEYENVIIGRELTKMHEEVLRGTGEELKEYLENNHEKLKGEFTVILTH